MERERALRPRATAEELSEGPISFAQKKWESESPLAALPLTDLLACTVLRRRSRQELVAKNAHKGCTLMDPAGGEMNAAASTARRCGAFDTRCAVIAASA